MVGGKGWDNNNYLDGLDGSEEDRELSNEQYKEEAEARNAFMERQRERMNNPATKKFMEQLQKQREAGNTSGYGMSVGAGVDGGMDDFDNNMPTPNSIHGGSRFSSMMSKSKQMQQQGRGGMMGRGGMPPGMGGFLEQKFAVPLDDDTDDENSKNDEVE